MTWTVEEIWRYYLEQRIRLKAEIEADIARLSEQLGEPIIESTDAAMGSGKAMR